LYGFSPPELASLCCAFLWAFSGMILRSQSHQVTPAAMNVIRCGVAGALFWCIVPFHPAPISDLVLVPWRDWALLVASFTIGIAVGDTLYMISIKEIGISRTMALTGVFPLTTIAWETLLLGNPLQTMLLLGSLLVVGGVYFLSLRNEKNDPQDSVHLRRGILVALFAAVLWGLSATLLKPATANMDIVHANATRMPLIALIVYLARVRPSSKETLRGVSLKSFAVVGFAGALGMGLSAYLFIYAIGEIGVAKVVTLSSISPLFGMAMAVVFFKEKVTWQVMVGVGLCLAGVWTVI